MTDPQTQFLHDANEKAADEVHRRKLIKTTGSYFKAVDGMKETQFDDWEHARAEAAVIKDHVLAHLPDLLEQFEAGITARGATVLWAADAAEGREMFMQLVRERGAKRVVKSKSMTTEELEINEALEHAGVEVLETDLGEMIVQVAGEKPYHIVTPAMHKTKAEIATLFHDKLGAPQTDDAEELTMFARDYLRASYMDADIGVTGANYLIAEDGAICITENEGNARLCVSCPSLHVVFAGIEKVLPRLRDLALFWPLLATSGTGQQITCYNSIIRGPRAEAEPDGPDEMVIILIDNGRSEMYQKPHFREALRCIRCGACLNTCPVYKTVGGHSYGTTYQGPIGSVITPQLKGLDDFQHLSYASSLCGSCTSVCPVKIPLHELLLENRWLADRAGATDPNWQRIIKGYAFAMASRARLNLARRAFGLAKPLFLLPLPSEQHHKVPPLAPKSFADLWEDLP